MLLLGFPPREISWWLISSGIVYLKWMDFYSVCTSGSVVIFLLRIGPILSPLTSPLGTEKLAVSRLVISLRASPPLFPWVLKIVFWFFIVVVSSYWASIIKLPYPILLFNNGQILSIITYNLFSILSFWKKCWIYIKISSFIFYFSP